MLNYKSRHYSKWIEFLSTNPPKTKEQLESYSNPKARCCLGHLCHVAIPKSRIIDRNDNTIYYKDKDCSFSLPEDVCKSLNITDLGLLTDFGTELAKDFLIKNKIKHSQDAEFSSLACVNDFTNATSKQIGQLIESLVCLEKNFGKECFVPFPV